MLNFIIKYFLVSQFCSEEFPLERIYDHGIAALTSYLASDISSAFFLCDLP
jgi:hypothetical protein